MRLPFLDLLTEPKKHYDCHLRNQQLSEDEDHKQRHISPRKQTGSRGRTLQPVQRQFRPASGKCCHMNCCYLPLQKLSQSNLTERINCLFAPFCDSLSTFVIVHQLGDCWGLIEGCVVRQHFYTGLSLGLRSRNVTRYKTTLSDTFLPCQD